MKNTKSNKILKIIDGEKWKLNNEEEEEKSANLYARGISVNTWHKMHNESLDRIKKSFDKLYNRLKEKNKDLNQEIEQLDEDIYYLRQEE